MENEKTQGSIKNFFATRGFGFVRVPGAADCFFHVSDTRHQLEPERLLVGAPVEFDVISTDKGLRAVNLELVEGGN